MHLGLGWRGLPRMATQSKTHLPPLDPWREGLPQPYHQPFCPAWPHHCGRSFLNWWTNCRKHLLPRFTWKELLLPYLILPRWKLTDPFIKLKALWSNSPIITKYFHWLIFRDSYCSLPSTPTKRTKPSKETKSIPQPSRSADLSCE